MEAAARDRRPKPTELSSIAQEQQGRESSKCLVRVSDRGHGVCAVWKKRCAMMCRRRLNGGASRRFRRDQPEVPRSSRRGAIRQLLLRPSSGAARWRDNERDAGQRSRPAGIYRPCRYRNRACEPRPRPRAVASWASRSRRYSTGAFLGAARAGERFSGAADGTASLNSPSRPRDRRDYSKLSAALQARAGLTPR